MRFKGGDKMRGSFFDGKFIGYIGIHLLAGLLSAITLGIAAPWAYCLIKGWEIEHTVVNNRRLKFTSNGVEVVGSWILLLLGTYLGLAGAAWVTMNLDSSPNVQRILAGVFVVAAFFYIPFIRLLILKWFSKHTVFDDRGVGGGVPVDNFVPSECHPAQSYAHPAQVRADTNRAPFMPIIFGIFVFAVGFPVAMIYHWTGWIVAVLGIVILIYAYVKQN